MKKPLILDFATTRVGDYSPIFEYDKIMSLNVVSTENGKIPFKDMAASDITLITKTRVIGEVDDDNLCLLALETKTKVKQESDDNDSVQFLQLETKTMVRQESDD